MTDSLIENKSTTPADTVDAVTRARIGSLAAHDIGDGAIADILCLSLAQVIAVKDTEEYKKKFAEEADRAIQAQIDRDEGWDAIEDAALVQILQTLEYNRDPKYALFAAKTANQAERRSKNKNTPHVIDNSKQTTNIIVLNLNKGYVEKQQNNTIDVTPRGNGDQPRRQSDLPSPKIVAELLAPVSQQPKKVLSELEEEFKRAGIVFDE